MLVWAHKEHRLQRRVATLPNASGAAKTTDGHSGDHSARARRPGDVAFFLENVPRVITVRVEASQDTRRARGWVFASGVDDAESECGLDVYEPWDVVLKNEDEADVHEQLAVLTKKAADALATQADSMREQMHKPT